MKRIEIESIEKLKDILAQTKNLEKAIFQSIDLCAVKDLLTGVELKSNVLLGCKFDEEVLLLFNEPLVFPYLPDLPFNPYRSSLYSSEELLGNYEIGNIESYEQSVDGKCYQYYNDTNRDASMDALVTLARRLHDHAISDALHEHLVGKKVVAIMGGHSMKRNNPSFIEVARLSRELISLGFLPISGGGPGAMEATHLGAWFAERPDEELEDAVNILSEAPLYTPIQAWLDAAFRVMEKYPLTSPEKCASLGIPTWLYGHEPPSCFATHIAKYFANSVREETLLAIATYGVIYSPGSAGTIQEIFQDATQNHYKSYRIASPMIFFGEEYWTKTKPVYPLLKHLAQGLDYGETLHISDDREDILEQIVLFSKKIS